VNLKINKFNEILFVHKLLDINILKIKQTYIERLSLHCTSYMWVNISHCEETSLLRYGTTLKKAASWVDACALGAFYWLAFNDTLLSSLLLEELAAIMCSRCTINFPLCIYTNLMNIWINNFDFLKNNSAASPLYEKVPKSFNPINRQHICHNLIDFI
jgi:S-methylmethionine-dependent homocysteine/selenocysteine methylase